MNSPSHVPNTLPAPSLDWKMVLAIITGAVMCMLLLSRVSFLGHDWAAYFSEQPPPYFPHILHTSYPPWVLSVVLRGVVILPSQIGLIVINGFTLSSVSILSYVYGRRSFPESRLPAVLALVLALVNPLPWMLLWLGQIDMLILLGLATLPFGIPILIGKVNMGIWAVMNSRRDIIGTAIWLGISLLIWGFWPGQVAAQINAQTFTHPIVMGWRALHPGLLLLGILLFLVTDRDPLRLMAAGSFISPYMMPYHYFVLLPALGRARGWRQILIWMSSFLMLLVAGIPQMPVKWMALSYPLLVWLLLAPSLRPSALWQDQQTIMRRMVRTGRMVVQGVGSVLTASTATRHGG